MLTIPKLIARNLAYHWRGNLAVLLGVAVGSAVLTGALLVGDSLRGSLRARVERQLGGIDAAALFPRPIRLKERVQGNAPEPPDITEGLPGKVAPVLMLPASLETLGMVDEVRSLGRVTVLGVDDRFKPAGVADDAVKWGGSERRIVLSDRVAAKLRVAAGAKVRLGVERFSDLARSSSFARRGSADVTAAEEFTVAAVLPADAPGNDFNLTPNPAAPLNVFVPLAALSRLVSGDADPQVNALLASGASADELNAAFRPRLKLDDYGLKLRPIDARGYLSVESRDLVIPPATVDVVRASAAELGLRAEPTIIYVADTLAHGEREIPYPVVAGLNPAAAKPLGPFLPKGVAELKDDEVVLLDWKGSPLNGLSPGATVRLIYFAPEVEGDAKPKDPPTELTLKGYVPHSGAALDRDLTPEIKGVTDARAELSSWDRPPVLPKEKIKARVPDNSPRAQFFNNTKFKATPMAYVNLATAEKLFGSRYGSVTSVRVAPAADETPDELKDRFGPVLLKRLDPAAAGLHFDPIRQGLLTASKGGTDFGGLFLGFSFFLIAAALMLVGLLFRLTLDRRAKEVGLLLAAGYAVRHVRRMLLTEGLALAVVGALVGLALGIGYNRLLLAVLLELWPDPEVANVLRPHTSAVSFSLGFGLTVVMALGALWLGVRGLVKVTPPALLRGETVVPSLVTKPGGTIARVLVLACVPLGVALVAAGKYVPKIAANPDYQAMTFFGGGGLLLTAGLAAGWWWMKRTRHAVVNGRGLPALAALGGRNAARNPARSLLTAALLASAAFLLVAVESFRRQPGNEFSDKAGGSGGFNLIAEADVPMFQSFTDGPGRADLDRHLHEVYPDVPVKPGATETRPDPRYLAAKETLEAGLAEVFPLRLRDGDDASCMNLFQAARPRVLGVPDSLIARGGFKFYQPATASIDESKRVWALLREPIPDGAIPVLCEQNTAQWMLKTAVGGEIKMPGDDGRELTFRIVGTFSDSPFQSELLMSDDSFAKAFPKTGGYRTFLIRTPPDKQDEVARLLALGFRANGLVVTPTRERVTQYQAVIGAYLSTFQLLGGMGLLLGVLGLAVVVLRSVWERVGELALLRAVGYRTRQLQFLVLAENALLLVAGLAVGVLAALISVAPHVASGAAVPWARLAGILALVSVVGLGVASAATAGILRVPVIPALRRE